MSTGGTTGHTQASDRLFGDARRRPDVDFACCVFQGLRSLTKTSTLRGDADSIGSETESGGPRSSKRLVTAARRRERLRETRRLLRQTERRTGAGVALSLALAPGEADDRPCPSRSLLRKRDPGLGGALSTPKHSRTKSGASWGSSPEILAVHDHATAITYDSIGRANSCSAARKALSAAAFSSFGMRRGMVSRKFHPGGGSQRLGVYHGSSGSSRLPVTSLYARTATPQISSVDSSN